MKALGKIIGIAFGLYILYYQVVMCCLALAACRPWYTRPAWYAVIILCTRIAFLIEEAIISRFSGISYALMGVAEMLCIYISITGGDETMIAAAIVTAVLEFAAPVIVWLVPKLLKMDATE